MISEKAQKVFAAIEKSTLDDLKNRLYKSALYYAHLRSEWLLANGEARREMDERRTRAHNAFIDDCNILSRNMLKAGEDNSWRDVLGDERREIGDFACYVHYILGLRAR